jgi:hypothetical protein
MKNLTFFALLLVVCFTNCGKILEDTILDPDCYNEDYSNLTTAYTEYSEAIMAFNEDATEANCQTVKAKGQLYVDSLEEWADCYDAFYPDEDFDTEIAEARMSIEDESCD